jgi:hypothetical protein
MFATRVLAALGLFGVVAIPIVGMEPPMPNDREVHVVCAEGAGRRAVAKAEVRVDRPGNRVTLVVGSDSEMAWEVTATNGTQLEKVILIGHAKQSVANLPKEVDMVEAFTDRQRRMSGFAAPYSNEFSHFRPMIRKIHAMTGIEVASFRGIARNSQEPIVVKAVQADPWLKSNYPTGDAVGLPDLEFDALYFGRLGDGSVGSPALAKFTLTKGPQLDSAILLPSVRPPVGRTFPFRRLVVDSANRKGYGLSAGIGDDDVVEIDLGDKSNAPAALCTPKPPARSGSCL